MPDVDPFLEGARPLFQAFYSRATEDDAKLMDALLHVHAALRLAIKARRVRGDPWVPQLERVTDVTEREFTRLWEAVRDSAIFRGLCDEDRRRIEAALFDLFP